MKLQQRNLLLCPSHLPQPLSPNLHAAEGEPFLAQVLQRGPDRIDGVVDFRFFYVWFSKSFVFLQCLNPPRPSHLAFVVRWVANRQAEQAVS